MNGNPPDNDVNNPEYRRCLNDPAWAGRVWPADKGQHLFAVGLSAIFGDLFHPDRLASEDRLCK